jgi:uridylate kinase
VENKRFKRILLKLSGESFGDNSSSGLSPVACQRIAHEIASAVKLDIHLAVVVGGGNILRGSQAQHFSFERIPADQIGMLGTLVNGIALQQNLQQLGLATRLFCSFPCGNMAEPFDWKEASQAFLRREIVIFSGGTGNPYFSTDTAAALRAKEIEAEVIFKATKVDGLYSDDPLKNSKAIRYDQLTYSEVLSKKLRVMDGPAIAFCQEYGIPICIFNVFVEQGFIQALCHNKGSLITGD